MAFKPVFGEISTEECESPTGFTYDQDNILIDGTIRLKPTTRTLEPDAFSHEHIEWDYSDYFLSLTKVDENWDRTDSTGQDFMVSGHGWYGSWPWGYYGINGNTVESGELVGIAETGEWSNVNNATGWTIEMRFMMPYSVGPDGTASPKNDDGGAFVIEFDDGTKAGSIFINPFYTNLVPNTTEAWQDIIDNQSYDLVYPPEFYYAPKFYPRTLRLTVKGDEVWVTTDKGVEGQTYSIAPVLPEVTEASSGTGLIGGIIANVASLLPVDEDGTLSVIAPPPSDLPVQPPQDPNKKFHFHDTAYGLASSASQSLYIGRNYRVENNDSQKGVILIDYVKIAHGEDHEGTVETTYPTGDFVTYTPSLTPVSPVESWNSAVYHSILPSDGTTKIEPQYQHDGGGWSTLSEETITGEVQTQDLSASAASGDLLDEFRFKVTHTASSPSGEAPRIDYITVLSSQSTGELTIDPSWGPVDGGTLVTLEHYTGDYLDSGEIYVDGTLVSSGDVTFYGTGSTVTSVEVVMPAHNAGKAYIKLGSDSYWASEPYTYVDNYGIILDTGDMESVFGPMRSPFRINPRPPQHAVNPALMSTTPVGVESHMDLTNLSDHEPSNLTGYGVEEGVLYNGVSGEFDFTDATDTDEVLITNRAAMYKSLSAPRPLYHKYMVGRDRFYLYSPMATGEDDLYTLRRSIEISQPDNNGIPVVWDILASSNDFNEDALPDNIYSIVLLTEEIPRTTMWVHYHAADRLNGYSDYGVRREIVNPVPVFSKSTGRLNFSVAQTSSGSYNLSVEV